ncbi:amino acid adenylation domain-containing protein [Croceitalea marina]|uniref:Amino acid adenylation domain-containing protein n=1 Tax=Croceitalea marina TaxID=1775166 RepID=A0ABW5N0R3_9FLAO
MVTKKKYPLTSVQEDVYYEQLLYPDSCIYNIGAKIKIVGVINIEQFKKAYSLLIQQHDAYRTQIIVENGKPYQIFNESSRHELELVDFSNIKDAHDHTLDYIDNLFGLSFNLQSDKLLHRFILIKVNDELHYLFSVYHHIITDGWGTSLMFQRLVNNYNELMEFGAVKSEYPYSYKKFIEDDLEYQDSESIQKDLDYWNERFRTIPDSIFIANKENKFTSDRQAFFIVRKQYNGLVHLAKQLKCSTFHIILGVLYAYFSRFYQNKDFSIGIPVLNRGKSIFKKTVGLFMGISPLRLEIDFYDSFEELVNNIKQQSRSDYRHQRLPLGKLIQDKNLYNQKDRLFNVTLSYEKQDYSSHFLNTKTTVIPLSHKSERVALAIYIREFDEQTDVKIDFDYNLAYWDTIDIRRIMLGFKEILSQILDNPTIIIKNLRITPTEEIEQILQNFGHTSYRKRKKRSFLNQFKINAKQFPFKIAVDDGKNRITYSELETLSNHVASHLSSEKGPIALLISRSSFLLVIKMGILKSARPFIPLDSEFPIHRLQYIIDNSKCKTIITERKIENKMGSINLENVSKLYLNELIRSESLRTDYSLLSTGQIAYIIYTSGSTGNPKGVEVSHTALENFLASMQHTPGFKENDYLYAVTTTSFDISLLELFLPLLSGGSVYVARDETLSDPQKVILQLKKIKPTVIQGTPSFFQMLKNAGWRGDSNLRILCGGDLLSGQLADELVSTNKEVWNMYGPTESTIWSSTKQILGAKDAINIGKPIDNTSFYLLDQWFNPVPCGAIGNLYIGGLGLAKGYYLNEKLTNEKFIESPFKPRKRIYNTGDVGKWNDKGEIIFLGRNDNQIKLRGYRIELGEIESKLIDSPYIKGAVAIVSKVEENSLLVAYIIPDLGYEQSLVFDFLEKNLPYYMIPQQIIPMDYFPLTANKKIDRKQLQNRRIENNITDNEVFNSELETKIAKIWGNVLGLDLIGSEDNFFRLGGHSLKVAKLVFEMNTKLDTTLVQKDVFENPTIRRLARKIKKSNSKGLINTIKKADEKKYYALTYAQKNIWFASQTERGSLAYNMNIRFDVSGVLNIDFLNRAFHRVIEDHEILRTNFVEVRGIPQQIIRPIREVDFEIKYYSEIDIQNDNHSSFFYHIFDLEKDCLMRALILEKANNSFDFYFSTHHIILDGLSIELLIKFVAKQYNLLTKPEKSIAKIQNFQFKDYSEHLNTINITESENHWKYHLKNYLPSPTFETSYSDKIFSFDGGHHHFKIPTTDVEHIRDLAKQNKITQYTLLLSLFFSFVNAMEEAEDICIGTVFSGRENKIWSNVMGMFANTVPLRAQIKKSNTLLEVIEIIQKSLLDSSEHQNYPIAEAVPDIKNMIDVLVVYQNPEFSFDRLFGFKDLEFKVVQHNQETCRLPLTFNFFNEKSTTIVCDIEFSTNLYLREDIIYFAERFKIFINKFLKQPTKEIHEIDSRLKTEKLINIQIDLNF